MTSSEFGPGRLNAAWLRETSPEDNPWVLSTDDPSAKGHRDAFLGNGRFGQRIGVDGEASTRGAPGEPMTPSGCLLHGFWDENALMPPPTWALLGYHDGEEFFGRWRDTWKNYRQSLDLSTGTLTTELVWKHGTRSTHMTRTVWLSRSRPNVAVMSCRIVPDFDGLVRFRDTLDGSFVTDARDWRIRGPEQPEWIASLEAVYGPRERRLAVCSHLLVEGATATQFSAGADGQKVVRDVSFAVTAGQAYTVTKFVALVPDDDAPAPWSYAANLVTAAAKNPARLRAEHEAAWAEMWQSRIEVPQPRLQTVLNATLYQMYCHLRKGGRWSPGPTGLSGNAWVGRAFWDVDLWMFPGLLLLQPDVARGMAEYRWQTLDGSRRNALCEGYDGAMISWESAETGDETIPERIFHHQHHVNSDVALAQWWYAQVSGDTEYLREKAAPIIIESARFWASYAIYNEAEDRYEIRHVCCADEFAGIRDNNAYTSYSAVKTLRLAQEACRLLGTEPPPAWEEIATKMWIPYDEASRRVIEYQGYAGETIKQADTALLVYPYEMPMADDVKRNIVDYYRSKYPKGNIMMAAAFDGIVDCELGRDAWSSLEALMPHFREPYLLVSESPLNECISFVTGLGGLLQLVLMGFAGIRIREGSLQVQPRLPAGLNKLTLHGLHSGGYRFDLEIEGDRAVVLTTQDDLPVRVHDAQGQEWPRTAEQPAMLSC